MILSSMCPNIKVKTSHALTLAPLGYLDARAPLGGGADSAPPPPTSRTGSRCETGEAAIESFQ